MKNKISIVSLLIAIMLIITVAIGTSYSLWTTSVNQVSVNTIDVGCFRITFNDRNISGAGDINLTNAYPMKNEAGKVLVPYKFSIENQCSVAASYDVNLETINTSTMDETKLDVYFNDSVIKSYIPNVVNGLSDDAKNAMNLTRGYLPAGESVTYSLRVWIDYNVTVDTPNVSGKVWNGRIAINSEATMSKPAFTNKVIGDSNVTLDIDTRSSKTVQTLTCYYGDEKVQETRGTEVGLTSCQYPLTAEYAKYTVTYTDGTSDTSYAKQLAKYLIKDGIEKVNMNVYESNKTLGDGYIDVIFNKVGDGTITYFTELGFDLSDYYGIYIDTSYDVTPATNPSDILFGIVAVDDGYFNGGGGNISKTFMNIIYSPYNADILGSNISRNTYILRFISDNYVVIQNNNYTPDPTSYSLDNFNNSVISLIKSGNGSVDAKIYNLFLQLAE